MRPITALFCRTLLLSLTLAAIPLAMTAQAPTHDGPAGERFLLLNLEEKKPVAHAHLILLAGANKREAREHPVRVEAVTDGEGLVTLHLDQKWRWFQLWHQVGNSCPKGHKATDLYHSNVLLDEGMVVFDSLCEPATERLQPFQEHQLLTSDDLTSGKPDPHAHDSPE